MTPAAVCVPRGTPLCIVVGSRCDQVVLKSGLGRRQIWVSSIGQALTYGPLAAFMAELFEPRVRYSAASSGLPTGCGGGLRDRTAGPRAVRDNPTAVPCLPAAA